MRRLTLPPGAAWSVGGVVLAAMVAAAQGPQPVDAAWVARQVQDRDTGRDSRAEMRMRLFDRQARVRERVMTLATLRGVERGQRADRVLIRFLYPNDIKGTGFLVVEHPESDDERFLFLPALGRVRRIAGEETQESFVGSDFTYEDIGGRELGDYTYALIGDDASWTPAPGAPGRPAWRLESRAKDANATYPRVVSLVLKDTFVVVHAQSFNTRGEAVKTFDVKRLEVVDGYWTALEMAMLNARDRTRTELSVTRVQYNVGLTDRDLSRRELERAAP